MATTSIWRVNGWLGKVLIYIENPDKTENPAAYEKQGMDGKEAQGLSDVIEYAIQQKKTGKIAVDDEDVPVMQRFVSGVNCSPTTARDEMIAVKKRFGKEEGTVAYHGYQSFAPGEATPEMAHEIGLKLAKALWGEKYQVLVATHLDKAHHLHNHFVVNTVSFLDGIKYHRTEKDYFDMQRESDRLCREYGLSVIENPQRGKSKHYGEWRAEQEGRPTYLSLSAPLRPAPWQEAGAQFRRGLRSGEHPQTDSGPAPPPEGGNAGAEAVQAFGGLKAGQEGHGLSRPLLPLLLPFRGIPPKAEPAAGPCAPRAAE